MRIAISSSGLGHVARGVETWALDTAVALAEVGEDVTLFAAGEVGVDCNCVVLPCMRRFDKKALWLEKWTPGFMWRWGLKTNYGWEQLSFWMLLWRKLRKGKYDVLHVQDPMLAYWCRLFRKVGVIKTKEILAHGTEEPAEWLSQFEYVQHLAPWHKEKSEIRNQKSGIATKRHKIHKRKEYAGIATKRHKIHKRKNYGDCWVMMPNFVDTDIFCPSDIQQSDLRDELGIGRDVLVVGTAATVKKPHKRIDYLIREFAGFLKSSGRDDVVLVIAGAKVPGSDELISMANELAGDKIKFCFNVPRAKMPDLYRTLDLFVLASVFEMMPIAVLEALASGLPVVCNNTPVLSWMIGDGGECVDMGRDGALAEFIAGVDGQWIDRCGQIARGHAVEMFGKDVVIRQYVEYYKKILTAN